MTGAGLTPFEASDADDAPWLGLAVEAAGVGVFDWDLATGELRWDDQLLDLFERDRAAFAGTIEAFNEYVHPDDRERVGRALSAAIASVGEYEAEYRVTLPSGRLRWIRARGRVIAGPDGVAARVVGAAIDSGAGADEDGCNRIREGSRACALDPVSCRGHCMIFAYRRLPVCTRYDAATRCRVTQGNGNRGSAGS